MQSSIKSVIRLAFGNMIEWYDFSLYIYFSVYIAKDFFPHDSLYASLMAAFATFFVGSLARPIGALLIGTLSDLYNPKAMINLCIYVMAASTVATALLPSYAVIGSLAPTCLVLLRIVQGLSVGGQFPGLISLSVTEYHRSKGLSIGLAFSISTLGFLLASVVGFFATMFLNQHSELVWRVPFALSGIFFLFYQYINTNEISLLSIEKKKQQKEQLFRWLLNSYKALIAVSLMTTMAASLYYLIFTYLFTYQITVLKISDASAFLINSFALFFACLCYPVFGIYADRIGNRKLFNYAFLIFFILVFPLVMLIKSALITFIIFAFIIMTLLLTAIQAAISPYFANAFDTQWRATGCALGYSVGNSLSGAIPMIALAFVHFSSVFGLQILMMLLLVIGFIGSLLVFYPTASDKI